MFDLFSRLLVKNNSSVPSDVRIYAIGDIHGCHDLLMDIHLKIENDIRKRGKAEDTRIIYLGDYIDRGHQSYKVIQELLSEKEDKIERIFIKGNHEETLLNFIEDPDVLNSWQNFGGMDTLKSYGVNMHMIAQGNKIVRDTFLSCLPEDHLKFFQKLISSYSIGDYFFCHAGIKPEIPLNEQKESDLMWIRDEFLKYSGDHSKIIVHGHTPVEKPELWKNRINIDTGAVYTGNLTCLVLDGSNKMCL